MVRLNLIAELSHFFVQLLRDQFFEEFFGQNSVNLLGEEGSKIDCFDGIGYPEKRSWKFTQPSPSDSFFVFAKNWCTVGIWVANKFGIQITVLLTDQHIDHHLNTSPLFSCPARTLWYWASEWHSKPHQDQSSICANGAQCYLRAKTTITFLRWGWLDNTGWVWFITFMFLIFTLFNEMVRLTDNLAKRGWSENVVSSKSVCLQKQFI